MAGQVEFIDNQSAIVLSPIFELDVAQKRLSDFQAFVREYLIEGEDYGHIPGIDKPSLFQPGADKLNELYGLAPTFPEDRLVRTVDWKMEPALFDYEVTCVLINKRSGSVAAEGKGSCSSYETRYRWRENSRKCTACGKESIIKGKQEYGGGWICYAKKGGCGAKFKDGDQGIEGQTVGKVPNESIADLKNTVLKIAVKRAKIAATLAATRSSGVFTQDVEDASRDEGAAEQPVCLKCEKCGRNITSITKPGSGEVIPVVKILQAGREKYSKDYCGGCQIGLAREEKEKAKFQHSDIACEIVPTEVENEYAVQGVVTGIFPGNPFAIKCGEALFQIWHKNSLVPHFKESRGKRIDVFCKKSNGFYCIERINSIGDKKFVNNQPVSDLEATTVV